MAYIVEIEQVTKTYHSGADIQALFNVSFNMEAGEFLAIRGPSGSGKSTLLHLIGTLDKPTAGRVVVDGADINLFHGNDLADFRRRTIGFVFQLFNLVPSLTALENVMLPLLPYQRGLAFNLAERAQRLLEQVGLDKRLHHLPGEISGGEQQRVAIARALINEPKLILADEPTGNLDSQSGAAIMALLKRLNQEKGLSLILVSHDSQVAKEAQRTIHLQDGRKVADR